MLSTVLSLLDSESVEQCLSRKHDWTIVIGDQLVRGNWFERERTGIAISPFSPYFACLLPFKLLLTESLWLYLYDIKLLCIARYFPDYFVGHPPVDCSCPAQKNPDCYCHDKGIQQVCWVMDLYSNGWFSLSLAKSPFFEA